MSIRAMQTVATCRTPKTLLCSFFRSLKLGDDLRDRTESEELAVRATAWHDYQQYLFRAALALSVRPLPIPVYIFFQ
jgi:hypothetical protein